MIVKVISDAEQRRAEPTRLAYIFEDLEDVALMCGIPTTRCAADGRT